MSHLTMSRREFAGVPVILTTASSPAPGRDQPRRLVALGRISRNGGQVTVTDQLDSAPARARRSVITVTNLNDDHLAFARILDALFCSDLPTGGTPTDRQLGRAIKASLRTYRTWNACERAVIRAFTAAPAAADNREEWCRRTAERALNHTEPAPDIDGVMS